MYNTIVDPVSLGRYNIDTMKGVDILQKFLTFGLGGGLPEDSSIEKRSSPDGTGSFSYQSFIDFYGGDTEWNMVGGSTDITPDLETEVIQTLAVDKDKVDEWQCKCATGGACVCESNFEIDSACLIYAKSASEYKAANNILTQKLAIARNTIRVWEAQYDAMRKDRDSWKKAEVSGEQTIKDQQKTLVDTMDEITQTAQLVDTQKKLAETALATAEKELRDAKEALDATADDLEAQKKHEQAELKLAGKKLALEHAAAVESQAEAERQHVEIEKQHQLALKAVEEAQLAKDADILERVLAERDATAKKLADATALKASETEKKLQAQLDILNSPIELFNTSGAKDKFKNDLETLLGGAITGELSLDVAANHTYQDGHQGFYYITLDGRILGLENTRGATDRELFIVVENDAGMHVEYYFEGSYHPFPLPVQSEEEAAKHLDHIKNMVYPTSSTDDEDSDGY